MTVCLDSTFEDTLERLKSGYLLTLHIAREFCLSGPLAWQILWTEWCGPTAWVGKSILNFNTNLCKWSGGKTLGTRLSKSQLYNQFSSLLFPSLFQVYFRFCRLCGSSASPKFPKIGVEQWVNRNFAVYIQVHTVPETIDNPNPYTHYIGKNVFQYSTR